MFLLDINNNLGLELFGYLGTVLVIISMLMTNINRLRVINMMGGLISLIYSACIGGMPMVVMNACLIIINGVQLIKSLKKDKKNKTNEKSTGEDNI